MSHFLVVFDRLSGRAQVTEYGDSSAALRDRFRAERKCQDSPSTEVVVLSAKSEKDLHRTHARYFESFTDIARSGLEQLGNARA